MADMGGRQRLEALRDITSQTYNFVNIARFAEGQRLVQEKFDGHGAHEVLVALAGAQFIVIFKAFGQVVEVFRWAMTRSSALDLPEQMTIRIRLT